MPSSRATSRWSGTAASPRSARRPPTAASAGAQACLIEVRGDAKRFKLSLLTDDGFDSLNYQASFAPDRHRLADPAPPAGRRSAPASAAARSPAHRALDPARIRQVGLMIAERQAGPFALDIRRISLA